jgi:hypothetical protein
LIGMYLCIQSFVKLILLTVDVWFALLTGNEFRSAYPKCEFLGEILDMY